MSSFPCGICSIGVRYKGILCTGNCKSWFHSKCLNWSDSKIKKLSKIEIETWLCVNCKCNNTISSHPPDSLKSKKEAIQEKILNLENSENDMETSFNLAIEAGGVLATENNELKRELNNFSIKNEVLREELHGIKLAHSRQLSELEDELMTSKENLQQILNENSCLKKELLCLNKKLEEQRKLKNELISQADNDRLDLLANIQNQQSVNCSLQGQIERLESNLGDKSINVDSLTNENIRLVSAVEELKITLEEREETISQLRVSSEVRLKELTEQENKTKAFLKSLLSTTQAYLTQVPQMTTEITDYTRKQQYIEKHENLQANSLKTKEILQNQTIEITKLPTAQSQDISNEPPAQESSIFFKEHQQ
ncbi:hypothetical protein J6590_029780 [Homalodisca vitripennis]|nr:hypothetical protein J6590_029780 [Homalodisca vitripennis]